MSRAFFDTPEAKRKKPVAMPPDEMANLRKQIADLKWDVLFFSSVAGLSMGLSILTLLVTYYH